MQNIIDETRSRVKNFLSGEEQEISAAAFYGKNEKSLINKIPPQNYGKLDKFVPISWL
ncbi:hypothetical protein HZC21_03950 [Candidatus Peregrinibacteria bacterium]|nr:hypothetical protein [Candidatus Peregrinibacteria bacterium]